MKKILIATLLFIVMSLSFSFTFYVIGWLCNNFEPNARLWSEGTIGLFTLAEIFIAIVTPCVIIINHLDNKHQ